MDREHDVEGARDAAVVLPIAAAFLLLPPVILIFAAPALLGGVPLIVAYLFGVWALIILVTFFLSRRLEALEHAAEDEGPSDGDGLG